MADGTGAELRLRGGAVRVRWPAATDFAPPLLVWFADGSTVGPVAADVIVITAGLRDFPAARELLEWSAAHAADLGAEPGRLLVGGDGPGAVLAALVVRHARDEGWPPVVEVGRDVVHNLRAKDKRMRKLVSNLFVSLDGVVEAPDKWSLAYWSDEIAAAVDGGMAAADAMLLGRVTYEGFAAAWPDRTVEDDEGADFMNTVRKYVLSTTLTEVTWRNSVLLPDNPAAAIRELKAEEGGDIMTSGSGTAVRWLLSEGLVDELNLLLYPVVVGAGQRLFPATGPAFPLTLRNAVTFGNGVVQLTYGPA